MFVSFSNKSSDSDMFHNACVLLASVFLLFDGFTATVPSANRIGTQVARRNFYEVVRGRTVINIGFCRKDGFRCCRLGSRGRNQWNRSRYIPSPNDFDQLLSRDFLRRFRSQICRNNLQAVYRGELIELIKLLFFSLVSLLTNFELKYDCISSPVPVSNIEILFFEDIEDIAQVWILINFLSFAKLPSNR